VYQEWLRRRNHPGWVLDDFRTQKILVGTQKGKD